MGGAKSKTKPEMDQTKQEKKVSQELDNQLWRDSMKDQELIKLLLLGAGESGKSTLFKQMIKIYGQGFNTKDLMLYIPMIYNNTVTAMKELCFQSEKLGKDAPRYLIKDAAALDSKKYMDDVKPEDKITPEMAKHIATLWHDAGIRFTFDNRSKFQLVDSADYFFNDIHRLGTPDFRPTDTDLIHCRVRTTGIVENKFTIDDNQFLLVDVGGQRNERKKWIHCFDGVTAVVFVVDASEYDKVLYEDGQTNRMEEALKLFAETVILKWFTKKSFILFLNKRDLFAEKIKRVPLTQYFKEFTGPNEFNPAISFIQSLFEDRYSTHTEKLYTHITCATDTNNVMAVFGAVKDIIIQNHLRESGLI